MLKILRDNLKYLSWILWLVVLVFIAFVFVDFGGALGGGGGGARTAAATVGGEEISYADFQREYQRLEAQYRQAFGESFTPQLAEQMRLPLQALDRLVDQKVLLGEADRLGLTASDSEVRDSILEIPGMKDAQGTFVGQTAYERFVRANGYAVRDFEDAVRSQILLTKLSAIFSASVAISDAEVEKSYRDQAERAAIRYLVLPARNFQSEVQLQPAEIAAYFEGHKEEFRLPVQRAINYLLVDTVRLRAKLTFEKAELQKYYDDHLADFTQEEQVRVRHLLLKVDDQRSASQAEAQIAALKQRVEKGEDLAKLASELSEDPASKPRGGDLGYFGRGRMIKEFEDAAFAAAPNSLVGPVRTSFGFHLIQVLDHRAGGQRPFAEVEGQVRAKLSTERADAAAEAKAEELARRIAAETLTTEEQLKGLADSDTVVFISTPPFGREEVVPGIGRGTPFSSAAFALEPGKTSTPVKINRGFAILSLKEEKPERLPELSEVEGKVRQALLRVKLDERATARLLAAKSELAAGKSLDDLAKELAVEVKESGEFGRDGAIPGLGQVPDLVDAALAARPGDVGGPVATAQGPALFVVTARQGFDPAAFANEKAATRETLERNEVNRLLGAIVEQKKRELKVNYDRPLLEQLGLLGESEQGS